MQTYKVTWRETPQATETHTWTQFASSLGKAWLHATRLIRAASHGAGVVVSVEEVELPAPVTHRSGRR